MSFLFWAHFSETKVIRISVANKTWSFSGSLAMLGVRWKLGGNVWPYWRFWGNVLMQFVGNVWQCWVYVCTMAIWRECLALLEVLWQYFDAIWRECLAMLEILRQCFDAICRECLAMLGVRWQFGGNVWPYWRVMMPHQIVCSPLPHSRPTSYGYHYTHCLVRSTG